MTSDPLSDVLTLLRPETYIVGGFDLGGDWSLEFSGHTGVKYFAVVSGGGWWVAEGKDAVRLEAGDCLLMPDRSPFVITKKPGLIPVSFKTIPEWEWQSGIATFNGGGDTVIIGGHFAFSDNNKEMLHGALPGIVRLSDEQDKEGVRWVLERMRIELSGKKPGRHLAVEYLAHLMLVQTLRLYLTCGVNKQPGWLFALSDPKIAPAIGVIHAEPGGHWPLEELARKAGMSRSKFAHRFKTVTGFSPGHYLTRWRMLLAADRLTRGNEPVSTIAFSLGYQSEAAFSTAFRRTMGCSPRRYGKNG